MSDALLNLLACTSLVLGQADADPVAAPTQSTMSILGYIRAGGFLSFVLISLSVLALGLMIANLITLRLAYLMPAGVLASIERLLRERNLDGLMQLGRDKAQDSFITRVMVQGVSKSARSQFGLLELKPALEEAAARELDKLDRPNHGLALLAAIGPMLGLLGTVFGMIGAFGSISKLEGAARSSELSNFMSMALVNTAEGLILAIPCTIAYSLFRRRTDRLMSAVGDTAERLAAILQNQAQGAAPRAAAPMPQPTQRPIAPQPAPAPSPAVQPLPPQTPPSSGLPLPPAGAARPAPVMPG
ncbi:MAG: MotA/TolQ/ExbB proton channel family protein [Phycisphaerae bacterium]|nr:MotA/TolQ/ExbB proton channel family protein [Phycisphaerae bacterium]